mmetsp:Transcript_34619/g.78247  ORF Transcript_34619/g.78247 Transcript_34619/m.78247 type:complete len:443 (+) Transcript_34619:74-1402(+)|eukprot:CAMPEP_0197917918 /NCGR_PEP_ID=MMETSP1439-20131203/84565_1 /TAXON_ID=66791 /ORGANISM="Gonyaulax spinifera, Strain CCMP409" /LENGTH=442 /DNA_ID=CAMNT_0043540009 /DNA_START=65 /DNA_END=1393 /DNA_ORIENTATION=-
MQSKNVPAADRVATLLGAACCGYLAAHGTSGRAFTAAPRAAGRVTVSQGSRAAAEIAQQAAPAPAQVRPTDSQPARGALAVGLVAAALSVRAAGRIRKCARSTRSIRKAEADGTQAMPILKLGTRGSPLALAQAYEAKRRLAEAFPELAPDEAVEIRIISTTGDQRLEISLSEIGGKGLFTRELDVALIAKEVDFCVHSSKDVPTDLIAGTELCTFLPREDTRDVLISGDGTTSRIEDFPEGSVIGTASLRRQAQIYAKNPGVKCVNFRGNVQTRLRKLKAGDVNATLLAYAGLKRMSMEEHATTVLEWDQMLPAISQGAISFQCRSDDERVLGYLKKLSHEPTSQTVRCERAFLAALDGNCKTPIAGQARIIDGELVFKGLVSSPDGQRNFDVERTGKPDDCETIGREAGESVRAEAGEKFFEEMQAYVQQVQAANTKPTK